MRREKELEAKIKKPADAEKYRFLNLFNYKLVIELHIFKVFATRFLKLY